MARSTNPQVKPHLLRGSLIMLRRKCGKPNCRCAKGVPHETPSLSYSVRGATQMLTLRSRDVGEVGAALTRYHKAVRALERQAMAGIRELKRRIEKEKKAQRNGRKR